MKIYIYNDNVVSLFPPFKEREWIPKGENVIVTQDPEEADFIVCPVALHRIKSKDTSGRRLFDSNVPIETLPLWEKYENKHVFFDCSDFEHGLKGTKAILVRCNVRPWMLSDKNTIPWFWPVDNLGEYAAVPEDGFKYDSGFHGWYSSAVRRNSVTSCQKELGDRFDVITHSDFFGALSDQKELDKRRDAFLLGQQKTRVLLCPETIPGVFPYRFYEAMSAHRVPILFATGYVLPFQNEIDWDKCTVRFNADQASNAGQIIKEFLNKNSDEKLFEMSEYGREMWVKWLNRDLQPELLAYALEKYGTQMIRG